MDHNIVFGGWGWFLLATPACKTTCSLQSLQNRAYHVEIGLSSYYNIFFYEMRLLNYLYRWKMFERCLNLKYKKKIHAKTVYNTLISFTKRIRHILDRKLCPYFWKAYESKRKPSLHVLLEIFENFWTNPWNEVDFCFAGIVQLHICWRNCYKIVK